jgi:hypothetical protein
MDGASYHKAESTCEYLKKQGVQTIVLSPYSYPMAPAELYFSHFKRTNLNMDQSKVGKK